MIRERLRSSLAAIFASVALAPGYAAAQAGATLVAVVTSDPNAPLTQRVRAELVGIGVDVIVLRPPAEGSPGRTPLEQAARNVGAIAAVRLVPSGEGVEVWVADRVTGKAVVRALAAPAGGGPSSDASVAIGTVELLRASLMELHSSEPPRGEVPATEQVRALALPPSGRTEYGQPRAGLSAGGGVELGLRGFVPSGEGTFALWLGVAPRFGVRALAALALAPAHVDTAHGSIEVTSQLVLLEACYDFTDSAGAWVPVAGLGFAAANVHASGTAAQPFVSASESAWLAAPLLHVGVAWAFVRGLRLRADALSAWSLTPVHVRAANADVGAWGAPFAMISLGVEVLWSP
jgi:hypothetical protein